MYYKPKMFASRHLNTMGLDHLRLSAAHLQALLKDGKVTSEKLVLTYLNQIETHNIEGACIYAVISTAPRAQAFCKARESDTRRKEGGLLGPMDGIPIIIKVPCPDSVKYKLRIVNNMGTRILCALQH